MNLQTKSFEAKVADEPQAEGVLEAVVSVFNVVDSYRERIVPGAFAKSLSNKLPVGLWMHDWTQPIARTIEAAELFPGDARLPDSIRDFGGLYIKAQFNLETQRGREAYSDVKLGLIDEFSIGYYLLQSELDDDGVLNLLELDLAEWSPVVRGANPATAVIGIKSDVQSKSGLRLCEQAAEVRRSVEALLERADAVAKKRRAKGKSTWLGAQTRGEMMQIALMAQKCERLASSIDADVERLRISLMLHKLRRFSI